MAGGLAAGAALGAGTAQAADFEVENLNIGGPGSLAQAIDDANDNPGADRIVFDSSLSGTITVADLPINEGLEILGPGADKVTLRRGLSYSYHVFIVDTDAGEQVTISGLTLTGGDASGISPDGGAIVSTGADLTIRDAVITESEATGDGGGVYSSGGELTITSSTISGNAASSGPLNGSGGGVSSIGGDLTIQGSTIADNTAGGSTVRGGGVRSDGGNVTITSSTISGNSISGGSGGSFGGGVAADDGELTIRRSTISGNTVSRSGGGVQSRGGDLTITSSTITGNRADISGGGVHGEISGARALTNTIVAGNGVGGAGPELFTAPGAGDPFDLAFSLIGDTADAAITESGPNLLDVDPQLGPLAANGGPTETHALPRSSPAVDKGTSGEEATDQRGLPRPVDFPSIANAPGGNGADIGAFELQPSPPPPPPPPSNGGPPPPAAVSNQFSIGKVRKNKRRGIAILRVRIPGAGRLVLGKNKKVKRAAKRRDAGGNVRLKVRPRGNAKRKLSKRRLRRSGKKRARVRVRARVTYRPTGGEPRTKAKRVRLVRRR